MTFVLAIDQGTTSTRAIVFDSAMQAVASDQMEFTQHFPASGWVEHDPEDLWNATVATCRAALDKTGISAGIDITNQRETTVVWDRMAGNNARRPSDRVSVDTNAATGPRSCSGGPRGGGVCWRS